MIDYLWTFQYRINGLQPHLLLVMALVALAVGLFVWLGGIGLRRVMFALMGAACGAACAIPVSGSNLLLAAALIGAGALLALKFRESFLTVMTSIFATLYGFSILIRPYFNPSGELIVIVRQLTIGVPYYNWPILLFLIALPLAAGASFWRATSAILCSAAGAAVMLAGVIMLMVRSGIAAAGFISTKREFFLDFFLAVTVLGAIMQLLLLPKLGCQIASARQAVKAKVKRAKKDKKDDDIPKSKSSAWRTA
jgi:hypothetical protein